MSGRLLLFFFLRVQNSNNIWNHWSTEGLEQDGDDNFGFKVSLWFTEKQTSMLLGNILKDYPVCLFCFNQKSCRLLPRVGTHSGSHHEAETQPKPAIAVNTTLFSGVPSTSHNIQLTIILNIHCSYKSMCLHNFLSHSPKMFLHILSSPASSVPT